MLTAWIVLYLGLISILRPHVCSITIPEDNPQVLCGDHSGKRFFSFYQQTMLQACRWDIKMCVDGTWVYRSAEINCEFEECLVKEPGTAV